MSTDEDPPLEKKGSGLGGDAAKRGWNGPETLDAWRKKGIVPCIKVRHVIRFDSDRVLKALAKL